MFIDENRMNIVVSQQKASNIPFQTQLDRMFENVIPNSLIATCQPPINQSARRTNPPETVQSTPDRSPIYRGAHSPISSSAVLTRAPIFGRPRV